MSKPSKKPEKIRLILADLTSDQAEQPILDKLNGYKTVVVTLPPGFETTGYQIVGIEWGVDE